MGIRGGGKKLLAISNEVQIPAKALALFCEFLVGSRAEALYAVSQLAADLGKSEEEVRKAE